MQPRQPQPQQAGQPSGHKKPPKGGSRKLWLEMERLREELHKLPKGTEERADAYKVWKQAQTRYMGSRPGASKKGVPRAETDKQSKRLSSPSGGSSPPQIARALTEKERQDLETASWRQLVHWAIKTSAEPSCPAGATEYAQFLWRQVKADERAFGEKYLPMLIKEEQQKSDVDEGAEASSKLIQDWIEEYKKGVGG